jgi:hypothetical protein
MIKKALRLGLALSALGLVLASPVSADEWDTKTVLANTAVPATPVATLADITMMSSAPIIALQTGSAVPTTIGVGQTSSSLTVIVLCGFVCVCLGTLLVLFRRQAAVAVK